MIISIRARLIAAFLGVSLLVGCLSLVAGVRLIYRAVLNEAQTRITQDLNAAREIYDERIRSALLGLTIAGEEASLRAAIERGDAAPVSARVSEIAAGIGLDFAGVVRADGSVLYRTGSADRTTVSSVAALALKTRQPVAGTAVLDRQMLAAEGPGLADRARIPLLPTPHAAPRAGAEEDAGMTLAAAVPLVLRDTTVGVLYGGILLNRNQDIVDRIRDTVFRHETWGGELVGSATIFLGDLRIATNVPAGSGERAIGTRVSAEVKARVLDTGGVWTDRAFVVNTWYVTAYEPITDIAGDRVGILYVGVLDAKYADVRARTVPVFVLITLAGIAAAITLGSLVSWRILAPVQQLVAASRRVFSGDLDPPIGPASRGEMGLLQRTFQEMLGSLRERARIHELEKESEREKSERQASVGRLAAGVAHEINNPLTGVLTFTHMLLKRQDLDTDARSDLQTIARSTERVRSIVKGLLDFARQTRLEPEPTDMNDLIRDTLALAQNPAGVKGVLFCFDPAEGLPVRRMDRSQMQSVILNVLINAIDATPPGGHIDVSTTVGTMTTAAGSRRGIEAHVADTGCGIPPENLDRIFDPFFTTKEPGEGTGLGLSVSLGIVERHGGTIRVHSRPGRGSHFVIWLPLEDREGAA